MTACAVAAVCSALFVFLILQLAGQRCERATDREAISEKPGVERDNIVRYVEKQLVIDEKKILFTVFETKNWREKKIKALFSWTEWSDERVDAKRSE